MSATAETPWRSALYPKDWQPGFADAEGHFLHDFSYAGYHRGEKEIPDVQQNVIDVTRPPYNADPTGGADATAVIQSAINDAGKAGGGVVFLPPGTYRVAPQGEERIGLKISSDKIVLRGAGPDKTLICCDRTNMRQRWLIRVAAQNPAVSGPMDSTPVTPADAPATLLTQDLARPTETLPVADTGVFAPGDLVVVRNDLTQHYIDLLGMKEKWTPGDSPNRTLTYYRRVISVDPENKLLTVDVPVRGFLYTVDNARVVKLPGSLVTEVGLEDFSIGMKQHPGDGLDDDETKNNTPGTTAYDITNCHAISMSFAENCWIRRVNSFCPAGNDSRVHILSGGIQLSRGARFVTVTDCDWKFPQYKGGGGNGYLFTIFSSDCLIRNCRAEGGRHNYSFGTMACSGNVVHEFSSKDSRLACDFHMFLSLANLLDNVTCDGDFLEAQYRPYGGKPVHGVTTTESVFWNTNGLHYPPAVNSYAGKEWTRTGPPYIVLSKQYGNGYVIGTRGPASSVKSSNYVEGIGQGENLEPRSLYLDQFARRMSRSAK